MANPTADLVSRLRASETENRLEPRWPDALLKEAADEIVRLRTALASIVVDDSDPPGYSPVLGDPRDYWEAWAKELERRAREALGSAADVPCEHEFEPTEEGYIPECIKCGAQG